jgi:predicted ATP-grasp superfamily ATP-dependent carboligase
MPFAPDTARRPVCTARRARPATVHSVERNPADDPRTGSLRWSRRPNVSRPVIIAAFEGWNDAGDAATTAARHVRDRLGARAFADLDPEEFFDFTSTRPTVEIFDGHTRRINWPLTELSAADAKGPAKVITLVGIEPQLKWRTFCNEIIGLARELDARLVLTLGALLAEVAHTRPTEVFGTSYDDATTTRLGFEPSNYEGPTGIVGVLHALCLDAGIPSASLWASVPSYVPGATSPKAALALVQRVVEVLDLSVPTTELEIASAAYERQVSRLVSEDEETAAYVEQLESRFDDPDDDAEELDADSLVEEVEQFLRNQE